MIPSNRNKFNLVVVLALEIGICLLLLLSAEIGVRLFWKEVDPTTVKYDASYKVTDAYGVSKGTPNQQIRAFSTRNKTGEIIYDVVYSIDSYGRRITPVTEPEVRDKFLLFFGCSYAYGEGVNGHETIPARVAELAKHYAPYNYAFHGHSPAEMLTKIKSKTLRSEVEEEKGDLIYIFFDPHVHRVIGSMRLTTSWGKNIPYYTLGSRDEVLRKGDMTTGRPILRQIYRLLYKSELLKFLKIDFPLRITNRHIHITARVIEESYKLYKEQFPDGNFYMVIYPGSQYGGRLAKELAGSGIKIVDQSKLFNSRALPYILSVENTHPSAIANEELAKQIVGDLGLN